MVPLFLYRSIRFSISSPVSFGSLYLSSILHISLGLPNFWACSHLLYLLMFFKKVQDFISKDPFYFVCMCMCTHVCGAFKSQNRASSHACACTYVQIQTHVNMHVHEHAHIQIHTQSKKKFQKYIRTFQSSYAREVPHLFL